MASESSSSEAAAPKKAPENSIFPGLDRVLPWVALSLGGASLLLQLANSPTPMPPSEASEVSLVRALEAQAARLTAMEQRLGTAAAAAGRPASGPDGGARAALASLALRPVQDAIASGAAMPGAAATLRALATGVVPADALATLSEHLAKGVPSLTQVEMEFVRMQPQVRHLVTEQDGGLALHLQRVAQGLAAELKVTEQPAISPARQALNDTVAAMRQGNIAAAVRAAEPLRADAQMAEAMGPWLSAAGARLTTIAAYDKAQQSVTQALGVRP